MISPRLKGYCCESENEYSHFIKKIIKELIRSGISYKNAVHEISNQAYEQKKQMNNLF